MVCKIHEEKRQPKAQQHPIYNTTTQSFYENLV